MTIFSKRYIWFLFGFLLMIGGVAAVSALSAPENVRVTAESSSSVTIRWNSVSGAAGYNVSRNHAYVASVTGTTYRDNSVVCGQTYSYKVQAYAANGAAYSPVSDLVFAEPCDPTPGANPAVGQLPPTVDGAYTLHFSDEFDGSRLDASKWDSSMKWGPEIIINREQQYYVDTLNNSNFGFDPFELDGDMLSINAAETPSNLSSSAQNQPYLSGVLTSKASFQYGYYEVRAKLPEGQGLWPAFWLLNTHEQNAAVREIDIMEFAGGDISAVFNNYHYSVNPENSADPQRVHALNERQLHGHGYTSTFHTFGVEWTADYIAWFIDGVEHARYTGDYISTQTMYLLLNLAVGETDLGTEGDGPPNADTQFPASYEIDYVRVYSKDDGGTTEPPSQPEPNDGENLIQNGDFSDGTTHWWFNNLNERLRNGRICNSVSGSGNPWDKLFGQSNLMIESGKTYRITFDARANNPATIYARMGGMNAPYPMFVYEPVALSTTMQTYEVVFTANGSDNSQLEIHLGDNSAYICLDNISVAADETDDNEEPESPPSDGQNLILNGEFNNGKTHWWFNNLNERLSSGRLCNNISSTGYPWDAQFGQSNIQIESGKTYRITFDARANNPAQLYAKVGGMNPPYTTFTYTPVTLSTTMQTYEVTFTTNDSDNSQLEFHLGGNTADICIDNISVQ